MDFHTANWAKALIAAYRCTSEKKWLEQANAAAKGMEGRCARL